MTTIPKRDPYADLELEYARETSHARITELARQVKSGQGQPRW